MPKTKTDMTAGEARFREKVRAKYQVPVEIKKKDGDVPGDASKAQFSRQAPEDPFTDLYTSGMVLRPPYDRDWLASMHEESDALQENVEAYVTNIVGMGFTLDYLGEDREKKPADAQAEEIKLRNWFDECNEDESFNEVLNWGFRDYCVFGDQFTEVTENMKGETSFAYHHPAQDVRLIPVVDEDYLEEDVVVMRDGKPTPIRTVRLYRRFVKIVKKRGTSLKLRYYKSFGDPRPLTQSGKRVNDPKNAASSLLWWPRKMGKGPYGLPPWIGSTFDVAGRRDAQALNWDLLRSQGISPLIIAVEGTLSDKSWDDVWEMMEGMQGVKNFNKISVLQVSANPTGINQRSDARIVFHDMSGIQKTDEMFKGFLPGSEDRIRQNFRNPSAMVGSTGSYSYATLNASKSIGQEQVYGPEQFLLAKRINRFLKRAFGIKYWQFKFKGPEVTATEDVRAAITAFSASGGLTINNTIKLVNDAMGRNFSLFDKPWANYPLPIVLRVLDRATLKGIEEIYASPPDSGSTVGSEKGGIGAPPQPQRGMLPPGQKITGLLEKGDIESALDAVTELMENGLGEIIKFDSAQPRDAHGRWTGSSGGGISSVSDPIRALKRNVWYGTKRERQAYGELKKRFPTEKGYKIIQQAYIRRIQGQRLVDPVSKEMRRIDFVVVQGKQVVKAYEVTSGIAYKKPQRAKEDRIKKLEDKVYIADPKTQDMYWIPRVVKTKEWRMK